jgi:glycine dehydrogenase
MATNDKYKRAMPGRLVGVSIDSSGQPAYRLALQTREQHIRREKATSNICTAQVLLAVIASMYAVYHGPDGLLRIAQRVHRVTAVFAAGIKRLGLEIVNENAFDTISIHTSDRTDSIIQAAQDDKINLRKVDSNTLSLAFDETTTPAHIEELWAIFGGELSFADIDSSAKNLIPQNLLREDEILSHPIFNTHHSETELLRYMRTLADKDIALDRAMIPLGSCTMKLNATTEMIPVTWPEFGQIHPFAPKDQTVGYRAIITELE